ncbi:hypothetical protein [Telluria antibiotica]|uniref:hypothetical protein n=1 Tax=Telluria antibiotica TaxID=2717319 RepID=UPI001AAEB081|nr:hypothetical protein [Telluria antibiotica]
MNLVDRVAVITSAGIERRAPRILVGGDAKAAALLERLAPTGYWNLLKKAIKR